MQLNALFRLGFPSAPGLPSLNLAARHDSQAHSTKGTPPPFRAATACGSMVSGSLSLPSRGAFHLSLTVLYSIGHMVVFSLRRWSSYLPSGFLVSRRTPDTLRLQTISRTGLLPPSVSLSKLLPLSFSVLNRVLTLHILLYEVWAVPISLATTFRIDFSFFSSG